jgi:RNA polymerase sigma-70 factor (family 1)
LHYPSTYDEKALLQKIASGDERAFRRIFDLYRDELYQVALQLTKSFTTAEEATQDVFVGLWVSRAHLIKVDDPRSYLYKILLNRISRYLAIDNRQQIIRNAQRFRELYGNTTEELVAARESQRLIDEAIGQLPPQQKRVYQLSRQEGLTTVEIADQLNITPLTAKSYLRDAMKFIRSHLKDVAFVTLLLDTWNK